MGNFVNRIWWGGDPSIADPFSGLTLRDIYHVQSTWIPVYNESVAYGMEMFLRLFRKDPITKTFFKTIKDLNEQQVTTSSQFQAHVANLMGAINSCVVNLTDPQLVAALMNKLGKSHFQRQIKKTYFEDFKEILTDVLQFDLKVNEQVMASWIKFIDFIYKHIYENRFDA